MKQTIGYSEFKQAFENYNRASHFPEGLVDLFEYLEDLESDTGSELELDVIGLCCDFAEDKLLAVLSEYGLESLDELRDHTTVIMVDDEGETDPTIIYQPF